MNEIWIIVAIVILFVGFGLARRGKGAGSCGCAGACEGAKKQDTRVCIETKREARTETCCEENRETNSKGVE